MSVFTNPPTVHSDGVSGGRVCNSDQRIVIFSANRNRNRFAKQTSVQIEIGIDHDSKTFE